MNETLCQMASLRDTYLVMLNVDADVFSHSEKPASCASTHPKLTAFHSAVWTTQALRFSINQECNSEARLHRQPLPQIHTANQNCSAGKPLPIFITVCNLSWRWFQGFAYMKQCESNLMITKTNDLSVLVFFYYGNKPGRAK